MIKVVGFPLTAFGNLNLEQSVIKTLSLNGGRIAELAEREIAR